MRLDLEELSSSRPSLGVFLESMTQEVVKVFRPLVLVSQSWGFEVSLCHQVECPERVGGEGREGENERKAVNLKMWVKSVQV